MTEATADVIDVPAPVAASITAYMRELRLLYVAFDFGFVVHRQPHLARHRRRRHAAERHDVAMQMRLVDVAALCRDPGSAHDRDRR